MTFPQPQRVDSCRLALLQAGRMNADGVGAVLGIRRRSLSLPRFPFLERFVAMQTKFGTFATGSRHVLNRRILVLTKESVVLGVCLVSCHKHFSIEKSRTAASLTRSDEKKSFTVLLLIKRNLVGSHPLSKRIAFSPCEHRKKAIPLR